MPPLTRVLFLGVDAADKDLIEAWCDEGALPTFRALRSQAAWSLTENPAGLFVGAIWPSFWTGVSPARHGRYCFSQLRTGTYEHHPVVPSDVDGEAFWEPLSRAGRRVAILDVPKTRPAPRLNGVQIVDWGTHDPELGFSTTPAGLAADITKRFGRHPVSSCDEFLARGRTLPELRDALIEGVAARERLLASFLEKGGWDLFLAVFTESHCAGHQFWHVHDPSHPRHGEIPDSPSSVDFLREVYVALDGAIGRLLARADANTRIFVLASHGMGPHYDGTYLLEEILRRLFPQPEISGRRRAAARLAEAAWRRVPGGVRGFLRPLRTGVKRSLGDAVSNPELASRPCFATPNNDVFGGIRVNVAGREPAGRIERGAELDAFCRDLTRDLLAFENVETGRPLVRSVLRTSDIYRGQHLDDLPDLLVEWDRDDPISTISSPKTGTIRGSFPGRRTGDHKPEGVVFVRGPGISPGRRPERVSVLQFAPTIASLLGVPLTGGDAAPVAEWSDAAALAASPSSHTP